MKSILTTSILALVFTTVAQATPPPEKTVLSRAVRQCVFDQTLEVGASVTGQFGGTFYGYPTATQYGFDAGKSAYGGSPSSFFISHYRDMGLLFAAPQYKVGNKVPDNQACMVTNRRSRAGTGQIERLLSADLKENFDRASIIIGIDLFYWDAIWGHCGYGEELRTSFLIDDGYDGTVRRFDMEYQIPRFIEASKQAGKILVLGIVPHENPAKVKINYPGLWHEQKTKCVDVINEKLRQNCTLENRCYLVDMGDFATRLNNGETIYMEEYKRSFGLYDMRPDGVHLSRVASKFVANEMVKIFEAHPPTCSGPIK